MSMIADVWVQDQVIFVEPKPGNKTTVQYMIREVGSMKFDADYGVFVFTANRKTAEAVIAGLKHTANYHPSVTELAGLQQHIDDASKYKNRLDPLPPEIGNLKGKSWGHQRRAYAFISHILGLHGSNVQSTAGSGLFAEMGTGKSRVIVGLLANHQRKFLRVLIISKKKASNVWPGQFATHLENPDSIKIHMLNDGPLKDRAQFLIDTRNEPGVFVLNYEVLAYKITADVLTKLNWNLTVCDEVHRLKTSNGVMSKNMARIRARTKYNIGMTGTPNADKPRDVFGIFKYIDPSIFGSSIFKFDQQYVNYGGFQNREIISYNDLEGLSNLMYTVSFRVTDEILDLPEEMEPIIVPVYLDAKSQAIYKRMRKNMVFTHEGETFPCNNTLTRDVRLQQITSGFISYQDEKMQKYTVTLGNDKEQALSDLVESIELTQPVVVFAKFRYDLQAIRRVAEETGRRYMEISGTQDDWEKFRNDDGLGSNILLGVQTSAGSDGIDLTRAHYVIWYSMEFGLLQWTQGKARVRRPGQTERVYNYYLQCPSTIDTSIWRALQEKGNTAQFVEDDVRIQNEEDLANAAS